MESLFLGLAALACPVGMGVMMWMMMRGQRKSSPDSSGDAGGEQQVAQLREEIDQLKAEREAQRAKGVQ